MSIFLIDPSKPIANLPKSGYGLHSTGSKPNNSINIMGTSIYGNKIFHEDNIISIKDSTIPSDHSESTVDSAKWNPIRILQVYFPFYTDTKTITITKTSDAFKTNRYNFFTGSFTEGYPENQVYKFCAKKISTVFVNNSNFYSSSYINPLISYKKTNFSRVTDKQNISYGDNCCQYYDLSGEYTFDRTIDGENQLISSDNNNVESGSFEFNLNPDYMDVKIYAKDGDSYIWIRFRPPLRWRRQYNDWTFNEFLYLYGNNNTETEFVKVVNCCFPAASPLIGLL